MTELEVVEVEVSFMPFWTMSRTVAPAGPIIPADVVVTALEKVKVPKLAKVTTAPFSVGSSKIHSALYSFTAGPVSVSVPRVPFVTSWIEKVACVGEVAVTVATILSPWLILRLR